MWASERWQHRDNRRDTILYHKQTVHVAKVALVLGRNIPYTFQFGYIIPNKLECNTFLYPPLNWCSVALADFRQKLECSRIAQAYTEVVQLGIHLQHSQNIIVAVCVLAVCVWGRGCYLWCSGCVCVCVLWFACQTIVHNALCVYTYIRICVCIFIFSAVTYYIPFSGLWS